MLQTIIDWLLSLREDFKGQSPVAQMIILVILAIVLINLFPWGQIFWAVLVTAGAVTIMKLLLERFPSLFQQLLTPESKEGGEEDEEEH